MNTPRPTPQQKPRAAKPAVQHDDSDRSPGGQSDHDATDDGILDEGNNPQYSDIDLTRKSEENESLPEG